MATKKAMEEEVELTEDELLEREHKRLQVEMLRIEVGKHQERLEDARAESRRRITDHAALEKALAQRRRICKHRKGGKNNNFANGNGSDYSLAKNVYPDGQVIILCTRCQSDWKKPPLALRKSDPRLYAEKMAEFRKMDDLPTDNTASGSQIYLIEQVA